MRDGAAVIRGVVGGEESVGRKVDVEWLVSATELYRLLGVTRPQTVHFWVHNEPRFPEPVLYLGAGRRMRIWYWPDVARWGIRRGMLPKGAERVSPMELLAVEGHEGGDQA